MEPVLVIIYFFNNVPLFYIQGEKGQKGELGLQGLAGIPGKDVGVVFDALQA